ncbi:MAG: UDP-N-acetylglucosamine 2-epimerase (non-hydrolyzing) [Bacteroidetes bacterium]|nr:MAG: UDP-N-acetylglucosamine 2-epimerase (non-hydrolyzing) [Bacteroidota bacterium]
MTKKIFTVIGARPQFIKAATVSRAIAKEPGLEEVIIHTGQHFDDNMSRIFFQELEIPVPAYNLDIHSLGHGAMTGRMLEKLEELMIKEKPDYVLVYGDTNSTLAGALAASKLHIPVAHVEAGLRSFNMLMPEEVNRILTDRIARILFCPTQTAVFNLQKEGFDSFDCKIDNCGDVMYDAAVFYSEKAEKPGFETPSTYALATLHRAENTDSPARLTEIFKALGQLAQTMKIVLPLHPRTRIIAQKSGLDKISPNIIVTEPVGYLNMIWLLKNCSMVMTDSGGLQKEAYFFQKPCITLRNETEWTELTTAGVNILTGSNNEKILSAFKTFQENTTTFPEGLYGDGNAAEKIAGILAAY